MLRTGSGVSCALRRLLPWVIASAMASACSGGMTDMDGNVPADAAGDTMNGGDVVGMPDQFTPDVPMGDGASGYTEPICADPLPDLSDLAAAYQNTAAGIRAASLGIADRRYPIGRAVIEVQNDMQLMTWYRTRTTFMDILNSFEVAVHEGGHIWDITMARSTWPYRIRGDLVITTQRLTNFNRSEILSVHTFAASDQYAPVYLMGMSGAQGFNTLLDEYVQYSHSLAARYCTRDGMRAGTRISARDGILTMMYYVEMYLRLARTNHPADYAAILADRGHIDLILTVWDRAEFWLALTSTRPELGLRDAMIRAVTYDPANLMEIQMVRARR